MYMDRVAQRNNIHPYYQAGDEKGANEVFELLNQKADTIRKRMSFESSAPTNVYLYKTQWQHAIREAGFITLTFARSWHIGDSHNGNLMMVSPYTPVKGHTHISLIIKGRKGKISDVNAGILIPRHNPED
jgi:hypothetical protein